MSTILYTAYDEKYKPLAQLTVPLMSEYAKRHDLDFDRGGSALNTQDGIYWTKFVRALEHLRHYERVIWLDADQMITNQDFPITDTTFLPKFGFHVSKDWGFDAVEPWHFSVCGFVAHRDCIPLFEEVLTMEPGSRGKPFPEQEPMRQVVRKRIEGVPLKDMGPGDELRWNAGINIHPSRFLNAVPNAVCPGKVVDPWMAGDFAAHLTMLEIPKRIELFHEIRQAGI